MECLGIGAGSHELYSCGRIALCLAGECERLGQTDRPCDSVVEYLQNRRLQNEQYLTQAEVVR